MVVTSMDASFAKEAGLKSQCGFLSMFTDKRVLEDPAPCSIVEFQSATIPRVVGSTMAAESASLSTTVDRHLYLRLVTECILYGEPNYGDDWRHKLKVPGVITTDAKSLFDHISTTGSVPKHRQTLIDLLAARDLVENKTVTMRWVPTTHMLADVLTKCMTPNEVTQRLLLDGAYSLVPTPEEEEEEEHRKALRQGQRQRAKDKKKARTDSNTSQ